MPEEKKYYCSICDKDLTDTVKILGVDAWGYHMQLHRSQVQTKEILRLRQFIMESYEGDGMSDFVRSQVRKVLSETPAEISAILNE